MTSAAVGATRFARPKLLVGEGIDDERFLSALVRHLGLADEIEVRHYGGKTNLRNALRSFTRIRGFADVQSIGITRDCDDSPPSALASVQSALRHAALPCPDACLERTSDAPFVSIFLVPDGSTRGALEDLLLRSTESDPARGCVEEFMRCVRGAVPVPPVNESRARVHAFLASREPPDLRTGDAAEHGHWDFDSSAFTELRTFISSL